MSCIYATTSTPAFLIIRKYIILSQEVMVLTYTLYLSHSPKIATYLNIHVFSNSTFLRSLFLKDKPHTPSTACASLPQLNKLVSAQSNLHICSQTIPVLLMLNTSAIILTPL